MFMIGSVGYGTNYQCYMLTHTQILILDLPTCPLLLEQSIYERNFERWKYCMLSDKSSCVWNVGTIGYLLSTFCSFNISILTQGPRYKLLKKENNMAASIVVVIIIFWTEFLTKIGTNNNNNNKKKLLFKHSGNNWKLNFILSFKMKAALSIKRFYPVILDVKPKYLLSDNDPMSWDKKYFVVVAYIT